MEPEVVCDWAKVYTGVGPAAPVTCFNHCPLVEFWQENSFVGLVAEVPNDLYKKSTKYKPSAINGKDGKTSTPVVGGNNNEEMEYFFAIIVELAGYRARMRYLGGESNAFHDIWINICDSSVHHVGWAAANGRPIVPPPHMRDQRSDWPMFLVERLTGVQTLPSDFNTRVWSTLKRCNMWPLRKGMRVEVADRTCLGRMKRAVIDKVVGGRLRLKYVTSQIAGDYFWCHRLSNLLHHVGWSKKVGHSIDASPGYKDSSFHKVMTGSYEALDASDSMFHKPPSMYPHFTKGMAMEAVDPLNLSQICIATVEKVLDDGYLMLAFDESSMVVAAAAGSPAAAAQLRATQMVGVVTSFSGTTIKGEGDGRSEVNLVCYHATSPYLLPPGFCRLHGIPLTLPADLSGHSSEEGFIWEHYALKYNKYKPAPSHLFSMDVPDHGFKVGMHVEAVDLMEPRLICIATVTEVKGRLLRVHFDGWDTSYDQWMDCDSPDIYPLGWCELVGHPIEAVPENHLHSKGKKALKRRKRRRKGQAISGPGGHTVQQPYQMLSEATSIDSSVDQSDDQSADQSSVVMLNEISPASSVVQDSSSEPPPLLSDTTNQLAVDIALSTSNEEMPELSPVPLSVMQRNSLMRRY